MYFLSFNHDEFDKYAEDHAYAVLNIATVLHMLSKEELTVATLSKAINTPERREQNRSVYDLYAVVARLEGWGYIQKVKDYQKHHSSLAFCTLTPPGRELLSLMPRYLVRGAQQYYETYLSYNKK